VIGLNYDKGTKTLLLSELEGDPTGEELSSYLENVAPPESSAVEKDCPCVRGKRSVAGQSFSVSNLIVNLEKKLK